MFILIAIVLGLIVGFMRRGRLKGLAVSIKAPYLLILSVVCEVLIGPLTGWLPSVFPKFLWALVILQYMLLFIFFLANSHLWPVAVMGVGVLMNFIVLIFNGGRMPVTQAIYGYPALAATAERIASGGLPEYFIMDGRIPLWFLGDIILIPIGRAGLASAGDLVLMLGMVFPIQHCMANIKPRHMRRGRSKSEPPSDRTA